MTPYLSTDAAVAGSLLADPPPVITGAAATGIIRALGLAPQDDGPVIRDWTTGPSFRSDLAGGAR
ncbi:hypothetical protein [Streptomyces sp. 4R-3d]|uniref:hypothetical protein n=1 Tax=Streptomyces sp. 4R-3d TaxID=2559605 RepID=UPI001071F06E|nr:hypothetical protein [Streptomyces sp. 4R-3d]TFI30092.1 hypothetical protein E4P36_04910 [Streptomyces sp. 4R-3d]